MPMYTLGMHAHPVFCMHARAQALPEISGCHTNTHHTHLHNRAWRTLTKVVQDKLHRLHPLFGKRIKQALPGLLVWTGSMQQMEIF